jgi:hypothetical protein
LKESGHYSIAGFFFQLLASAGDAMKIYFSDESKEYPYTVLYPIFRNLEYEHRDLAAAQSQITEIADRHGMHDHEVQTGINTIVGFLNEVAKSPGEREITRQLLIEKLVGRPDPVSLTSDRSLCLQQNAVTHFKDHETQRATTIDRTVYGDIASAASLHPFVLVKGEGGCGKSVAVSEAARLNLASRGASARFRVGCQSC